jgi:rRNA maturation RNase YbeY
MQVRVADRQLKLAVATDALQAVAKIALAAPEAGANHASGVSDASDDVGDYQVVGIALVGDAEMRQLNRAHRRLDRTTDVLSFDLRGARGPGEPRAGEIVISTDRVLAQARRYRVPPAEELARLLIHGILHLRGHDHHEREERRRMRALERAAMTRARSAVGRLLAPPAPQGRR